LKKCVLKSWMYARKVLLNCFFFSLIVIPLTIGF
jgi:hypothetical protein